MALRYTRGLVLGGEGAVETVGTPGKEEEGSGSFISSRWSYAFMYLFCCWWSLGLFKAKSEVTRSCLTLRDPTAWSPPRSSVHGIFQAGTLEWVAVCFSRGSSRPGDETWGAGRRFTVWATRIVIAPLLGVTGWGWHWWCVCLWCTWARAALGSRWYCRLAWLCGGSRSAPGGRTTRCSPISAGWMRAADAQRSCCCVVGSHRSGRYEILGQRGFMLPHLLMTLNTILYFYGCLIFWNCVRKCICVFTCLLISRNSL